MRRVALSTTRGTERSTAAAAVAAGDDEATGAGVLDTRAAGVAATDGALDGAVVGALARGTAATTGGWASRVSWRWVQAANRATPDTRARLAGSTTRPSRVGVLRGGGPLRSSRRRPPTGPVGSTLSWEYAGSSPYAVSTTVGCSSSVSGSPGPGAGKGYAGSTGVRPSRSDVVVIADPQDGLSCGRYSSMPRRRADRARWRDARILRRRLTSMGSASSAAGLSSSALSTW